MQPTLSRRRQKQRWRVAYLRQPAQPGDCLAVQQVVAAAARAHHRLGVCWRVDEQHLPAVPTASNAAADDGCQASAVRQPRHSSAYTSPAAAAGAAAAAGTAAAATPAISHSTPPTTVEMLPVLSHAASRICARCRCCETATRHSTRPARCEHQLASSPPMPHACAPTAHASCEPVELHARALQGSRSHKLAAPTTGEGCRNRADSASCCGGGIPPPPAPAAPPPSSAATRAEAAAAAEATTVAATAATSTAVATRS